MNFAWNSVTISLLAIVGLLIYLYFQWTKGYFTRRGIKSIPFIPLIGNNLKIITQKEHFTQICTRLYNEFPDQNYVGHMQFGMPLIIIKDLNTIKQITVKDFDYFMDHAGGIDENYEPLFGKSLPSLKGERWKDMRAILSPAFTSSKMRNMFQFVEEMARQMSEFYLNEMKSSENKERGLLEIEMRDAFTRYTNDVIATSAFGIKVNSFTERDNEFYKKGSIATNFSGIVLLKFFVTLALPKISKMLGIKIFSASISNFFRYLVLNTMENREKSYHFSQKKIVRNDMIQLLMEAKKGSLKHNENVIDDQDTGFATVAESNVGKRNIKRDLTDDDMVAQAFIFFVAGFDTTSTLLSFMAHELTVNPDVQKKLQDEIDEIVNENGPTLNYDDLAKMKYMDMVVTETLRFWSPAVITDRKCLKKYTLPPISNSSTYRYTLNPGEAIAIPIFTIHRDPKYYENPEVFDPERFSDENKHKINPSAFMPFGLGPRNCIGSRFALMETKAVIFHLLAKFDFVETAKTHNSIELSTDTFNLRSKNGFWIGLKPRDA